MRKILLAILVFTILGGTQVWSCDFPSLDGRFSGVPYGFDTLRNTSRLTDEELRYGFERLLEWHMARMLDRDQDGIADFTGIHVAEFIERMKIILSDRKQFRYVFGCGSASHRDEWLLLSRADRSFDI